MPGLLFRHFVSESRGPLDYEGLKWDKWTKCCGSSVMVYNSGVYIAVEMSLRGCNWQCTMWVAMAGLRYAWE